MPRDHFFHLDEYFPVDAPLLEGYTGLAFLAGRTRTCRLGLLVTGVTYRHPGVLAKTVSSLDVVSGGRATFGIGAAWYEREHLGLGIPFPPTAERFERLEETIQICRQMWSGEAKPYDGRHYRLAELAPYRDLGIDTVYTSSRGDVVAFAEHFATHLAPRIADL